MAGGSCPPSYRERLVCDSSSDMGTCVTCVAFMADQSYRLARGSSERRVSVSLLGEGGSQVTDTNDDEAAYTLKEMCAIIDGLSKSDMQRLALYAARFANTLPGTDPRDLLHHALLKASLGERQCPRGTAPITFLGNVMRSELSNLRRKSKQTEPVGDQEPDFEEVDDDSPEAWAERMDDLKRAIEEVQRAFGDDTRPMIVFEGRAEGLSRDEIRELLDLDLVAYESLEKKIRRFMNKRLSEGRAI